jgi:hypothetical protein
MAYCFEQQLLKPTRHVFLNTTPSTTFGRVPTKEIYLKNFSKENMRDFIQ